MTEALRIADVGDVPAGTCVAGLPELQDGLCRRLVERCELGRR